MIINTVITIQTLQNEALPFGKQECKDIKISFSTSG